LNLRFLRACSAMSSSFCSVLLISVYGTTKPPALRKTADPFECPGRTLRTLLRIHLYYEPVRLPD
jgi:hypothetical protein